MSKPVQQNSDEQRVKHRNHRTSQVVLIALLLSVLYVAFASFYSLSSPDGCYYDPGFGLGAKTYLVFERGQYLIRTPKSDQFVSTYSNRGDVLVFNNQGGSTEQCVFKATILGTWLHDPSVRPEPDTFLFRRGFSWVPKVWGWIQLHLS